MLTLFILLAILVILVLSAVAIYFNWKVYKQNQRQQLALAEIEKTAHEKYQKIKTDIVFIAQSYLMKQVELPEASLRISRLADLVIEEGEPRNIFHTFDEFAQAIAAIPTHEDWKLLTKSERKKHEKTMTALTESHEDAAKEAAKKIVEFYTLH